MREALAYRTRPTRLFDLYAFSDASHKSGDPCQRLRAEFIRLISGSINASRNSMEQFPRGNAWRLCEANATYSVCPTYPSLLVMPSSVRYFSKQLLLEISVHLSAACFRGGRFINHIYFSMQ